MTSRKQRDPGDHARPVPDEVRNKIIQVVLASQNSRQAYATDLLAEVISMDLSEEAKAAIISTLSFAKTGPHPKARGLDPTAEAHAHTNHQHHAPWAPHMLQGTPAHTRGGYMRQTATGPQRPWQVRCVTTV